MVRRRDERTAIALDFHNRGRPQATARLCSQKHHDAEAFLRDERGGIKLQSTSSGGIPLCHDDSTLRIRLANAVERARYREKAAAQSMGNPADFLVDVDE